jgi:glycosyltransferase involved in cell wall biosynthesis
VFVSYAQNFEDVVLRRVFREIDQGFYLDIGGSPASRHSASRAFREAGWGGIAADAALRPNPNRDVPPGPATLASLWNSHVPPGRPVHFLRLEAAGNAAAVLAGNDWSRNRPIVVLVATAEARDASACAALLAAADYQPVHADGRNRFYLAVEQAHRRAAFHAPDAQDAFVPHGARKAAEIALLRAEAAGRRAETAQHALGRIARTRTGRRLMALAGSIGDLHLRLRPLRRRLHQIEPYATLRRRRLKVEAKSRAAATARFDVVHLAGAELHFANGAFSDPRGIGRVAREQFRHLRALADERPAPAGGRAVVRYYPTIHWCPAHLEPGSVVMVHDVTPLIIPEHFPDETIALWKTTYRALAGEADHIVTISESSARSIRDLLGVPSDRISVIHNGVTRLPVRAESPVALPSRPFVVFVGAADQHKNLTVVIEALGLPAARHVDLVMIGENRGIAGQVAAYGLADRVHFLDTLADDEVGHVLSRAIALVFPSLYEGFGLPPLEAALLGVPSICSDVPAMNELVEAGVTFCDPRDPHDWAEAIGRLAAERPPEAALAALAESIAERFSWAQSARQLAEVLERHAHR